jgi:nuclear transport factor 2 (NTF2) superfamily protein
MSKCGKRAYNSESLALDALIEAKIRFEQNTSVTVYQCQDCGEWHLTSKGLMHPRLEAALRDGSIAKDRRAFHWQRKLGY